jgi:hypothetical protein
MKLHVKGNRIVSLAARMDYFGREELLTAICERNFGKTVKGVLIASTITGREIRVQLKRGHTVTFFDGYMRDYTELVVDGVTYRHPNELVEPPVEDGMIAMRALIEDVINWIEPVQLLEMSESTNFALSLVAREALQDAKFVMKAMELAPDAMSGWLLSTGQEMRGSVEAARVAGQEARNAGQSEITAIFKALK